MKKFTGILCVLTMLVSVFAGCAGDTAADSTAGGGSEVSAGAEAVGQAAEAPAEPGEKVQLSYWWGGSNELSENWCKAVTEMVEEAYPNIELEALPIAWSEYPTKISVSLAGGTAADILSIGCLMFANFDTKDQNFLRLTDKLEGWDGWEDIYPNILEAGYIDGEFCGVLFPEFRPFFWRKDLFEAAGLDPEAPPQTLEELYDYAKKLSVVEGDIVKTAGFQVGTSGACDQTLWALMNINGVDSIWDDDCNLRLNEPAVMECVELYNNILQEQLCGFQDSFDISGSFFMNGMAAMSLTDACNNKITMQQNLDWENVGVASPPGELTGMYGSFITVNKATRHEKEALQAWEVIVSGESMLRNAEIIGYVPSRVSTEEAFLAQDPEFNKVLVEMLGNARMYGKANYDFVYLRDTCLNPTFSQMFYQQLTPQQTVDQIISMYDGERAQ